MTSGPIAACGRLASATTDTSPAPAPRADELAAAAFAAIVALKAAGEMLARAQSSDWTVTKHRNAAQVLGAYLAEAEAKLTVASDRFHSPNAL